MMSIRTALVGSAFLCAVAARTEGQTTIAKLSRVGPTTGLADSTLFLCNDSTKVRTRACGFADFQKRLAFKPFDSIVVTNTTRLLGTVSALGPVTVTNPGTVSKLTVGDAGGAGSFAQLILRGGTSSRAWEFDVNGVSDRLLRLFPSTADGGTTFTTAAVVIDATNDSVAFAGRGSFADSLITRAVRPTTDNTYALGTSSFRWSAINASSLTLTSSATIGSSSNLLFSGRSIVTSPADQQLKATNNASTGPAWFSTGLAYQTTDTTVTTLTGVNADFSKRSFFGVTISANVGDTIRSPTFPSGASATNLTLVAVRIKNTSGGSLTTAPVWNAVWHFGSGGTPAAPSSAQQLIVWFVTDGTTLWEIMRTTGIAN